jgi:hypothetical protein
MSNRKKTDLRVMMTPQSLREDFDWHLRYTLAKDRASATDLDCYNALALSVRDRLVERWIVSQNSYHKQGVRRIAYLSLEFLMGRLLGNNVINLGLEDMCNQALADLGIDWNRLRDLESSLPAYFIRINKSSLANENRILRFEAVFNGGVDAVFRCGYKEYVSRRCFAEIKRRYDGI